MKEVQMFQELSQDDLVNLYTNYMTDLFVDPNTILIVPFETVNAIYYILKGGVDVYVEIGDDVNSDNYVTASNDIFSNSLDDRIYEALEHK
jgi:hypothetical protein